MAFLTDPFAASDVASFIPEIWSPIVLEEFFAKAVAANFFTDLSSYVPDGGDIVHVSGIFANSFTTSTQYTQGQDVTTQSPAGTDITLTIDTHNYIAFLIGDKDMKQISKTYDFNAIYAKKAAGTLITSLEDSLLGLWSGLATNSIGDTATVLSDAEVRQSVQLLDAGNFDLRDCAWFVHPYVFWNQLGAIAKYYDASQSGATKGFTVSGNFGDMTDSGRGLRGVLYDMPVFVSSRVASGLQTYRNLLAHKSAFGFAIQTPSSNGTVRVQSDYRLRNLGTLTVCDMLYGVVELRDAAAVVVNASSSFIGS